MTINLIDSLSFTLWRNRCEAQGIAIQWCSEERGVFWKDGNRWMVK